ncbi:nicotinamide riboside transporter PnuC [Streptomyces tateyamensis]|uniref:Nicotinamide riboside transporter PnuC n=1 Tax=Streptomyces tateyamensis TaxID=565073 RepID=A0A2V4N0V3_9ACTN|nr:nicotinamide riboside transporter PnuC [Streptomyces tateyamensis]PYC67637.1 nicotinamide riboside transporter PnuC [Streptomyces tateyamensis]
MSSIIDALNHPLFQLGNDAVSSAELLGFVTGAVGVWLCVRAQVWNFPIGIANNVFFLVLFWSARLYADAALQVVFLLLGAHGWFQWRWRDGEQGGRRVIGRAGTAELLWPAALVVPATWLLTVLLTRAHDTAPFWDALTTALSLAAQWLLNAKRVQNWYFWVAADLVYVPLYVVKRLDLTALVYVVFLGMCLVGLRDWRRQLAVPAAVAAA